MYETRLIIFFVLYLHKRTVFGYFFACIMIHVNVFLIKKKKILKFLFIGMSVVLMFILVINEIVEREAKGYLYSELNEVPAFKVGVVLGTSRYLANGKRNPFFESRIRAAKALYFSGKIQYLIVSGDNRFYSYNEPREMRKDLLRLGIPDSVIFMDFAGFRTLDSVLRAKLVYKLKRFIIISQQFHNERAVYIARFHGIEAIGYNAKDPTDMKIYFVSIREYFARVFMMIDLMVLKRNPHFLGNEKLPDSAYNESSFQRNNK